MSGSDLPSEAKVSTTKLKRKHFSEEDHADLDRLDGIFKRIKKAVTQPPYIISTPSLIPYTHRSRQESQAWMMGRLFKADEEHLQYRTFLFREPYQDCFTLQPGEDEEPEVRPPKSQVTNAAPQVAKKKISLSDYKSKHANGVITPGSKKVSPQLPPTKASTTPTLTNGVKPAGQPPPSSDQKQDAGKPPKRPAPSSLPEKPGKRPREEPPTAPTPPSQTESAESKINLDKSGPSNATPHGLPPLLSPVDQPLSNPYGLPAILSPTLPASIQVELDRLETQRKRTNSNASTSSSDRKSQLLTVPEASDQKRKDVLENTSRERSVSLNGKSPTPKVPVHGDEADTSLVVKLKYTKKSHETIKRLLNLPPKKQSVSEREQREEASKDRVNQTPKKAIESPAGKSKPVPKIAARRPDSAASTTSSKAPASTPKVAEKRPRTDDDTTQPIPSKRARAHSSLQDGPITPKDQLLSSPALSTKAGAQRSQGPYSTPRKDTKAMNMLRTASTESHDSTPGKSGTTGTPDTGSRHLDAKAPTSAPLNSKKQMDISLLSNTSMKLNVMGRSLKHEAQKLEKEKGNKLSKEDQKRAAVIGLECILSYMAAYHAQDLVSTLRGRPAEVEGTWKTLLPLCVSYARLTKDFQHIDGFRSHLGAVIAAHICFLLAPRAPNLKAHDSPHELPQPELAKQHGQLTENFALLSKHYMLLFQHTRDARILLPMEDLQKRYKKTWAGAESNTKVPKGPEKVNAAKLSGPYFLPIQNDTTPIQAVRFGLRFLAELCEQERIDYTIKINLDKVD